VGPDTTLEDATILGALRSATRTIHAEVFYAYVAWGPFSNPYLDALVAAARRGVQVRLLLDSSSYNVDDTDPNDNDNTVSYLNGIAAAEGLDLQARLVDRGLHGLSIVHNKGFVVDEKTVLVSSVNWNRNSATANREAGLLVTNGDLAAYFDRVFAWDWKDDFTPPTADAGPDRAVAVGTVVTFDGRGSSDDVGVVNWTWDLDGDGADDAWGPEVNRPYDREGAFVVRLRVADADGNTATDNATVSVRPPAEVHTEAWILLAAFAGTFVALVLLRRRRQRLSKPPRM
ncbi:MAG TPA: phospholipase D-like domain-containing protein, partial [Thermoplasmata archaeon]|nr:phospholipase D-like domain-containing protein [Thermoplasmata archaeon]